MKKILGKRLQMKKFPGEFLFVGGFLAGVILPDLIWKYQWPQKTAVSMYLLESIGGRTEYGWDYFKEVLSMRGGFFLLCALLGFSIFGVAMAVLQCVLLGLEAGILLSASILQFGVLGGVLGTALLFPHFLLYYPAAMHLSEYVWKQSVGIWKNRGLVPQKIRIYCSHAAVALVGGLGGILLESYINPVLLSRILEWMKFI